MVNAHVAGNDGDWADGGGDGGFDDVRRLSDSEDKNRWNVSPFFFLKVKMFQIVVRALAF